ncbi:MAG: hypothetical protein HY897_15740 [Deltaproteobacteria bacterium]|nr:hypothetical protein [Deltaproteobacteria bacterium]
MAKLSFTAVFAVLVLAAGCAGDRVEYASGAREGALACTIGTADGPEVVPGQAVVVGVKVSGDAEIERVDLVRKWTDVTAQAIAPSGLPFEHDVDATIPAGAMDGDRVEFVAIVVTKDATYVSSNTVAFEVFDVAKPDLSVALSAPADPGGYRGGDEISVSVTAEDLNSGVGLVSVTLIGPVSPKSFAEVISPVETSVNKIYQTAIDPGVSCGRIIVLAEADDGASVPNHATAEALVLLAGGTADSAAPAVVIESPAPGAAVRPGDEVTVKVSATDDCGPVTEIGYTVGGAATAEGTITVPDGGANPTTQEIEFTVPSDAAHNAEITVSAWAVDAAGRSGEAEAVSVDLVVSAPQAPTAAITSPADSSTAAPGAAVTVNVSAGSVTGKVTRVTLDISGSMTASEDFVVDPPSADVKHAFTLNVPGTAKDGDTIVLAATAHDDSTPALTGTSSSVTVNVAVQNPTVRILFPQQGQDFHPGNSPRVTVNAVKGEAPIAKVGYTADGLAGVIDASEEFTVDPPTSPAQHDFFLSIPADAPEGDVEIIGTAADQQEKPGTSPAVTINIKDKTPPAVTVLAPVENQSFAKGATMTVSVRAVDASSNVATVTINVAGVFSDSKVLNAGSKDWTDSWNFTVPAGAASGDVYVYVRATDSAAAPNTSSAVSVKAKVN